ncbi:MAG: hypothetical protein ACI81T_001115 [Bacteroidia bacterium]|jgi:hypothetical protein
MKHSLRLFFILLVFVFASCENEDATSSLIEQLSPVEVVGFQLVTQDAGSLPNGVYDASLEEKSIKVRVKNQEMKWLMPQHVSSSSKLVLFHEGVSYEANVYVKTSPEKIDVTRFLEKKGVGLGFDLKDVQMLTTNEQEMLAQFLKVNESLIENELSMRNKLSLENKRVATTSLPVGQSITISVESSDYWNASGITVNSGEQYKITAAGTWTDWYIDTDANGYSNWYLKLFTLLKRSKYENWFKLIATTNRNQQYPIGSSSTITIGQSGDLDFFANDANGFYWNNYGSIDVTITRIR